MRKTGDLEEEADGVLSPINDTSPATRGEVRACGCSEEGEGGG